MKNLNLLMILLVFCACAKHYESVVIEPFLQKSFKVEKNQAFLLFVSKENEVIHFVLTDALGVPKLKKDFRNGQFHSVAFLHPNAEFDTLFYEILKHIQKSEKVKIAFEFEDYEVKEL